MPAQQLNRAGDNSNHSRNSSTDIADYHIRGAQRSPVRASVNRPHRFPGALRTSARALGTLSTTHTRRNHTVAQQMHVQLIDDLDPEQEADETVLFGLDGVEYEIDLSGDNAEKLRDALSEYLDHARRTGGRTKRGRIAATTGPKSTSNATTGPSAKNYRRTQVPATLDAKSVREWALDQGMKVSDRGRIPSYVTDAYKEAKNIK